MSPVAVDPAGRDVAAELQPLYEAWFAAISAKDVDWFERHFAEDLHVRNLPRQQQRERQAMIAFEQTLPPMRVRTLEVIAHAYPDAEGVEVAVARWSVLIRPAEAPEDAPAVHAVFSTIWRHEGTTWRVVDNVRAVGV